MDLLDRYLMSVGFLLPLSERAEILAELRDILLSKLEDKEEDKGAPLSELEREAVLYDFGHPLVVAGRYRKDSQVIGPAFYPFWLLVMQIGTAATVVSVVVAGILRGLEHHNLGLAISWAIVHGIGQFVALTGVTTLVFLYLERSGRGQALINRWRPSQLPAIKIRTKTSRFGQRFERGFEVAGGLVALLFWTGLAPVPVDYPVHGDTMIHLAAAPLVTALYWPVAALIVVRVISNTLALFQLGRQRQRALFSLVVSLASFSLIAYALWGAGQNGFDQASLASGPYVRVTGLAEPALGQANYGTNLGIAIALAWGMVGTLIAAGASVFRLARPGSLPTR
jgi:hypothetical protein